MDELEVLSLLALAIREKADGYAADYQSELESGGQGCDTKEETQRRLIELADENIKKIIKGLVDAVPLKIHRYSDTL